MSGLRFSAAAFAVMLAAPVFAQVAGPAETPPTTFTDEQYVDSKGCVFLRADYGDQIIWMPRLTHERTQMCGYPPTAMAASAPAVVEPKAKPVAKTPAKSARKAPAKKRPAPVVQVVKLSPERAAELVPTPPRGYKHAWKDGRLNPNRGKQTLGGVVEQDRIWARTTPMDLREAETEVPPPLRIVVRHPDGTVSEHAGVVVSTKGDGSRVVRVDGLYDVTVAAREPAVAPATGDVAPAVAVAPAVSPAPAVAAPAPAPAAPPAAPALAADEVLLVRVGTYGVPENADRAVATLSGLGLGVGLRQSGTLQVVYAGPYHSPDAAKAALAAARKAGFDDAVVVRRPG